MLKSCVILSVFALLWQGGERVEMFSKPSSKTSKTEWGQWKGGWTGSKQRWNSCEAYPIWRSPSGEPRQWDSRLCANTIVITRLGSLCALAAKGDPKVGDSHVAELGPRGVQCLVDGLDIGTTIVHHAQHQVPRGTRILPAGLSPILRPLLYSEWHSPAAEACGAHVDCASLAAGDCAPHRLIILQALPKQPSQAHKPKESLQLMEAMRGGQRKTRKFGKSKTPSAPSGFASWNGAQGAKRFGQAKQTKCKTFEDLAEKRIQHQSASRM